MLPEEETDEYENLGLHRRKVRRFHLRVALRNVKQRERISASENVAG
jgi:hypothetical protein